MNIRLALSAVAAGTLLAGSAIAEDKAYDKAYDKAHDKAAVQAKDLGKGIGMVNQACMNDAQRFCRDKIRDDKTDGKSARKVFDCLNDNKSDLAQPCRDYVDTFAACKKDFDKHCKDQNIFTNSQCLEQKRTDLSENCRNEYDKYAQSQSGQGRGQLGVCQKEFDRYCADVQPGSGQEWSCLSTNRVYLSEACRKDVEKRGGGSGASQGTGIGNTGSGVDSPASGTGMGNEGTGSGSGLKGTEGYEGSGSSGSGSKNKGHTHDEENSSGNQVP